jgi:putative PIN family toxin of toxin-antitoxin system
MRLVLDTDVIVAAIRSPAGASAALLLAIDDGLAEMLATVPLFLEYEAICHRPEHMLASGLRSSELAAFFDRLVELVVPIEPWFLWRPQLHDAADEMVLEAAVNGQADALVSFNRRHFLPAAERFGLPILLPGETLGRLRK